MTLPLFHNGQGPRSAQASSSCITLVQAPLRAWGIVIPLLLGAVQSTAQPFLITGGSDNTCVGAFLDSGGQGALGYANNEDETYTLCPDAPGSLISVTFVTFNLSLAGTAPIDNLTIYDGNTTGAPLLGSYTGNTLQGQTVSASAGNPTGCLTFVWHSNSTGTGVFAGSIHCYVPCVPPVAAAVMGQAAPARICVGEAVNFNGTSSTSQPGTNITIWAWDFDDGTSATTATGLTSHVFDTPGVHTVQLTVTTYTGCSSVNRLDLQVWVGTIPTFTGTGGSTSGCAGETLCLDGVVNAVEYEDVPEAIYGDGVFIPDDVGSCFEAQLYLTQFAPGATLTNINQLLGLCMNFEHTWLGDLVITITSPSGQSVILHQQGITNETWMGQPVDNDEVIPVPGTCEQYCFANTSPNGTMAAFSNANNGGLGYTLPPDTYQSLFPLTGLLGSQLNGLWTLTICDMWALDNGFLCDWSMDLDPALYANIISYTPQYGVACDSTWWTGPNITSTQPGCESICLEQAAAGTYPYVYHATDNFGCTYDTTINITIAPPIVVNAGPDAQMCAGGNAQLNGIVLSGGLPPPPCAYTLELLDSFGDGWDGAWLTIMVNGVPQDWTLADGTDGTAVIQVMDGDPIQITYHPSALFNNEHSYTLYDMNGAVAFTDTPPFVNGVTWNGIADCGAPPAFTYSWSPATGLSNANIADPLATPGSTTVYTLTVSQVGHPNCTGSDAVTVTITTPVNAGTDASITLCSTSPPVNLFSLLGGGPNTSGTWTAPGGGPSTDIFTPGTSTPGVYTYSVVGVAPCPGNDISTVTVTVNPQPNAGTDGVLAICSNNAATNLGTLITGSQAGGTWTDPSNLPFSGWYDPAVNASGVYTYTIPGIAPCTNDQSTVVVTESAPPYAGTDGATTVCDNGGTVDLFALLGGGPDVGGSWTEPSGGGATSIYTPGTSAPGMYTYTIPATAPCSNDQASVTVTQNNPVNAGSDAATVVCANGASVDLFALLVGGPNGGGSWSDPGGGAATSTYTPGTSAPGAYTYTVNAVAPCVNDQATVTVTENNPVNAGTDAATTVCANGATIDLFALLGGGPNGGGSWSDPGGGAATSTYTPGTSAPGAYTYTVNAAAPCVNDQATVTVTQNNPPNAGLDGATTLCISNPVIPLFDELGGTPDAGGTWTGPDGSVSNGTFTPGTNSPGIYTYSVPSMAPCPLDLSTVTVAVTALPDPGLNGTLSLCANAVPVDLFASLAGTPDPGGTWTDPGGASVLMPFDPAVNVAGVYTYTMTVPPPCVNVSSTVTVTIQQPPNAGTNGSILLCVSSPPSDLFADLGGAPDVGGTWTAPGGGVSNGTFAPGTSTPGIYTYTVTGTAPCPSALATVTVTVSDLPDPGTNGTVSVCANAAAFDLFASLGGTPDIGGVWTAPGGAAQANTFDPATDVAGVYTYTITVPPPCVSVSATVMVTLVQPPDAGVDGSLTLCVSSPGVQLFNSLGGSADLAGAWTAPGGGASTGTYTPGTSVAGIYTYTVAGTAPCPNDISTVNVTVVSEPDPGTNGALVICATGAATDLFALLGGTPDAGGTWTSPGGGAHGNLFDPAVDAAGPYTYSIAVPPPCISQSAVVNVTIQQPPNAGTDGALTLCISGGATPLITALGGGPSGGGTWTAPGGGAFSGIFIPGTSGAGGYTYTVTAAVPCPNASATVTVAVTSEPDPGVNGALVLCTTGANEDLFAALGGTPDPGGLWTAPGGAPHSAAFNPASDVAGIYTYTLTVPPPCTSASSTVTVLLQTPPNAGTNSSITLCTTSNTTPLFPQLGGSPTAGGTWTAPGGGAFNGSFVPGASAAGTYTYTVAGVAPCPNSNATVVVGVNTPPSAGGDGTLTLCSTGAAMDLFTALAGAPGAIGTWTAPGGSAHGNSFDPMVDAPGAYTYTVVGIAPCPNDQSVVIVSVIMPPDPGVNGSLTLCSSGTPTDLMSVLGGTPDAGGSWTAPGGSQMNGTIDPATASNGAYTYTVPGTTPCPAASAQVMLTITPAPDAGQNGAVLLCGSSPVTDLFPHLAGTPDPGGTWSAPGGGVSNGQFDPSSGVPGLYTYSVQGTAPCPNATATVLVNVTTNPDAGLPGNATLCTSDAGVALLNLLNGSPDAGGTWTAPGGATHPGMIDPSVDPAGTYTYNITVPPPCVSASSTVVISLMMPADPGTDGTLALCSGDGAVYLFAQLGGTPDAGGSWTVNGGAHSGTFDLSVDLAGTFTYTVASTAPCPAQSADVIVSVNDPPDPGTNGNVVACISGTPIDLFYQLGGTPAIGGTWNYLGASHAGLFDPSIDAAGDYAYTVLSTAPCPSASSIVSVTVVSSPDAGIDGAVTLCTSATAADLFTQLNGTPDAGGTWSGPSPIINGAFDPATMLAGDYTYSIDAPAPCPSASSHVVVTLMNPPDAGSDGTLTLCISSPASALFLQLGGTPALGGSWTDPLGQPHGPLFNPSTEPSGDYTYTVIGTAPCPSASAVVTMNVMSNPDPGTSSANTLCLGDAPLDLFAQLGGTPDVGGTWSGPSTITGGLFDPGSMSPGIYTYLIDVPPPCVSVSSTVTIALTAPPNAGLDGNALLCISSPTAQLNTYITGDPQPGGTWIDANGAPFSGSFVPGADQSGTFTYIVAGDWPCPADSVLVSIDVVDVTDPGESGALTLCQSDNDHDLFSLLEGDPDEGGTWSGPSTITNGIFDPGVMAGGVYTYLLDAPAPCLDTSSTVTVTVVAPPDAGADGANTLCATSDPFELFTVLTGSPEAGGTWTAPGGAAHTGTFTPGIDGAGSYVYTVQGAAPCPAAIASVNVTVIQPPNAGGDGQVILCFNAPAVDLFTALSNNPGTGGSWTDPNGAASSGTMDPATDDEGIYIYTVQGTAPCGNDQAQVDVIVGDPINATVAAADAVCQDACDGTAALSIVGGTPTYTMLWSANAAGNTAMSASGLCAGEYTVTVTDAGGCTGIATYVINEPPPLVINALTATDENCISSCDGSVTVTDAEGVLFSIDGGATWSIGPTLGQLCAGDYTVMMQDANGCMASAPATVMSPDPVLAAFYASPDTTSVSHPLVVFTNQTANAETFMWNFAGLGSSTEGNPSFIFPDVLGGTYSVCLTAINSNGCMDTVCHPVVVLDELFVNVPNAFTPNGDGLNEGFCPILNDPALAADYTFMIFDRWGLLIFESTTIHEKWNAKLNSVDVPEDVYVWKMHCRDIITKEVYDRIGHVTVVR